MIVLLFTFNYSPIRDLDLYGYVR